jgi:DNA-binding CsgD family transcriptional regulator
MENNKPSYEALEQELNEYKDLLWQLSDEYRLNMGNIEKKLQDQIAKYNELENRAGQVEPDTKFSFITSLGLPACILNRDGKLVRYNNKFKFLIELLSVEIEEISDISALLSKDKVENLPERLKDYFNSEDGVFQSLFKVENSFQGLINLILRVYKFESGSNHLALFIELHKSEIMGLDKGEPEKEKVELKQNNSKTIETDTEINLIKTDIAVFAEKYDVYTEILKHFENANQNQNESLELLQNSIKETFNLEHERNKLLEKLSGQLKDFVNLIRQKYPDLTPNEEKHCMLVKAGLTYKEISSIMDISINGVKIARNRLRKKLDLENDTKTSDFIDKV